MRLKQIEWMRIHEDASRRSARYHGMSDSPLNAFFFLLQDPSLKKLSSDRGSAYFSVADLISAFEIIASPEHILYKSLGFCVLKKMGA